MRDFFRQGLVILLGLFTMTAVHAGRVAAHEVTMQNDTPHAYFIEYTTWSTDPFYNGQNSRFFSCAAGPGKTCKTDAGDEPLDTGSMGVKLTGEFKIRETNRSGRILSTQEKRPEPDRQYRCFIWAFMRDGQPVFLFRDH